MTELCKNCKFFDLGSGIHVGECRRYPPAVIVEVKSFDHDSSVYSETTCVWPIVNGEEWCGEYKQRRA